MRQLCKGNVAVVKGASPPADFAAPGVQVFAIPAAKIADKLGSTKAARGLSMFAPEDGATSKDAGCGR